MKVLITGGGGFIGSHLADRLLADGNGVLALDNYATGRRDNLSERDGLTLVDGDIADREQLGKVFSDFGPDVVAHAAASYKDPDAWTEDARTNSLGGANVVEASRDADVGRIVYFQTALTYGTHPLEQPITLDHPIRPDSSYAISKTTAEQYIALSGIPWVSLRLANIYGPRNLSGPPPTFYQRLSEDKPVFVMDSRRDFIYVDDLIEVVIAALNGTGEGAYHVSTGSDYSIKEMFDAVVEAMGHEMEEEVEVRPRPEDDAPSILLDPSRTKQDFGWEAKVPLQDGIARAIEWYRENGVGETYTHLREEQLRVGDSRS
jgi:UDP-glucose 4-epimerase